MPGKGRSFIIAGAGISGMTLALGLAKFGANVTVLERSPTLQEFGAGLQVSPNARHVLNGLGLDAALAEVSFEPQALDVFPQGTRKPVVSMELGELMRQRFGAPYAVMHRADLANVLYKACRRFANIDINFGVRQWDVASSERGVTVTTDDAAGHSRTTRADAFIGADGVHSQTRRNVLKGGDARFGRRIAWRALVPFDKINGLVALDRVSIFLGSGFHLVCYPTPHRGQVNLALFTPGDVPDGQTLPHVAGPGQRVEALIASAGPNWTPWPLFTVETPRWYRGNIGVIGDAAHAMVPFQAQGAAMGIEDAATLAPLLVAEPDAESAFERYSAARRARVSRVAALSAQNGKIFHMPWPISLPRDAVIRLQGPRGHLKRLGWIYDHKVDTSATHAGHID